MKRLIACVSVLILLCFYMWSCEKDDICADTIATTPNLVIEFYDIDDVEAPKTVSAFKYFIQGSTDTITKTGARIEVPLLTNANSVKWGFRLSTVITGGFRLDTDFLEFNYTHTETYVSRACGFKSTFVLNGTPVLTDAPGETRLWIKDLVVTNPNIETDTPEDVHVKIYF